MCPRFTQITNAHNDTHTHTLTAASNYNAVPRIQSHVGYMLNNVLRELSYQFSVDILACHRGKSTGAPGAFSKELDDSSLAMTDAVSNTILACHTCTCMFDNRQAVQCDTDDNKHYYQNLNTSLARYVVVRLLI